MRNYGSFANANPRVAITGAKVLKQRRPKRENHMQMMILKKVFFVDYTAFQEINCLIC